jgi:hypothetical protein
MKCLKYAAALLLVFAASGCTYALHQNHTSDYKSDASLSDYRLVEARFEQFVVMGFVSETNYADDAFAELQRQCPDGIVTGIQTRHSTSHGFFSWKNVILMQGYCTQ